MNKVVKNLEEKLPLANIEEQKVQKNNSTIYHAILITEDEKNICPTIYIDKFFMQWENGRSLESICNEIMKIYIDNKPKENIDISFFTEFENIKNKICFKLVNYEKNTDLLMDIPYKKFLDLAVVFFVSLEEREKESYTILIRNEHLKYWNLNVNEIWTLALKNTPQIFKYSVTRMDNIISRLIGTELETEIDMLVLSNWTGVYGASVIMYEDILQKIADSINKDFYILPSSIHEIILLPSENNMPTEQSALKEIVKEINDTQVMPEELLSYNVYYYSREKGKIIL